MSPGELKSLAATLAAIADGAEWECQWEMSGWGPALGRDLEHCIAKRIPIRLKGKAPVKAVLNPQIITDARARLLDVYEELAAVSNHLQEAVDFSQMPSKGAVKLRDGSIDDAQQAIDNATGKLNAIRDIAGRWTLTGEACQS